MKIVFFGTPEIAMPILESLHRQKDMEILAVVTQPDKQVGRKQKLTKPPVKQLAEKLNLKIIQPENKKQLLNNLGKIEADFFVVVAYGMILPTTILEMPKIAPVNIHFSLLPKYRGSSPIQEALLHGDTETGISIIKIDNELDRGNIYFLKRIPIQDTDTLNSLWQKLALLSGEILPHVLRDIESGSLQSIPQNHANATHCHKISKEDGKINWHKKDAIEIKNMIRAYNPWPGTYTDFNGKKLNILAAETDDKQNPEGKFVLKDKILKIGTKQGSLIPKKVQLEGKKPIDIGSFINGYRNLLE